jgi:hypothetical protein
MISKSFCVVWFAIVLVHFVTCYSSGAGGCDGGKAAVGGSHTTKLLGSVLKRTLAEKKIKVSVGGVDVAEGKTVSVATGKTHAIKVEGVDMKGVLIRVKAKSGVSTKGVLTAGTDTQLASACASPVVGVTHKSSTKRKLFSGNIKFSSATSGVVLDITVVYKNSLLKSEYAYGQVKVNFVKA